MRWTRSSTAVLLSLSSFIALGAASALVPDLNGTWDFYWGTRPDIHSITVTFEQDGSALSGTAVIPSSAQSAEDKPQTVPITDGSVMGTHLSFKVNEMRMGEKVTLAFNGTVSGDTIEGFLQGATENREGIPFNALRR